MYWHLIPQDQDIPQCSIFREKKIKNKKYHPSSFGSHSWGSTDETRNSISCFAPNWSWAKKDFFLFVRPAVAKRADPSPLLKSAGTGIFKTGHDLLKGQGQLKTHISGWAYYYQWGLQHDRYQGGPPTPPPILLCCFSPALWLRVHASWAR